MKQLMITLFCLVCAACGSFDPCADGGRVKICNDTSTLIGVTNDTVELLEAETARPLTTSADCTITITEVDGPLMRDGHEILGYAQSTGWLTGEIVLSKNVANYELSVQQDVVLHEIGHILLDYFEHEADENTDCIMTAHAKWTLEGCGFIDKIRANLQLLEDECVE